jgi:hypothetical protein
VSVSDAQDIITASDAVGGDHFGISDEMWGRLEYAAQHRTPPSVTPPAQTPQSAPQPDPPRPPSDASDAEVAKWRRSADAKKTRLEYEEVLRMWEATGREEWEWERQRRNSSVQPPQPPSKPPPTPPPARPPTAPPDPAQHERDEVIGVLFGSGQPGAADRHPVSEVELGVELLSAPTSADVYHGPPNPSDNSSRRVLIGGGILALLLVTVAVIVATRVFGLTNPAATSSPAAAFHATPSALVRTTQASASIGGIGENSTKDPALVVCQIRGTVLGMEFHGTLSGPNIGSSTFDVKSGQPSQGVQPTSPYEAVFAVAFPGKGGQHGGGPLGPFTCTLTAVDVPSGYQLAPHQPSDWSMTVT